MRTIRNIKAKEVEILLDWAAKEGWNPGIDDGSLFHTADPNGFFMAYEGARPVAGISVIQQGGAHGFLGLYICHPDYRGRGHGWAVWQAGMAYLDARTVGLDGVVEQQDNYRKSGFAFAYRNIRYAGTPTRQAVESSAVSIGGIETHCRRVQENDWTTLMKLDENVHGYRRNPLLKAWLTDSNTRHSVVQESQGSITGYGTVRQCQQGHKIGPLIADSAKNAQSLLANLISLTQDGDIVLDVPEPNTQAIELAGCAGLEPTFETARMYKGLKPQADLQRLFGVTSFELG